MVIYFVRVVIFILIIKYLYKYIFSNNYKEIEKFSDVIKWKQQHPTGLVVNVLTRVYWENCNILNSVHWPLEDIKRNKQFISTIQKPVGFNTPILLYCAHKTCFTSKKAQIELTNQGFKNVYRYTGGMSDWILNNQPANGKCDMKAYAKCFQHNCKPPYPP